VAELEKVILASDVWFESIIYVLPAGATTYQQFRLSTYTAGGVGTISGLEAIPSQSIFMLRVLSNTQATTQGAPGGYNRVGKSFTLDKRSALSQALQVHDETAHNTILRSAEAEPTFRDEVLFRITPEENPNVYDLTAVGLRPNAKETFESQDLEKVYLTNNEAFTLYSLSTDERKLSANVVPPGTSSVKLCLNPGISGGKLTLTASRTESLNQIWLEDLFTHLIVDLKQQDSYSFAVDPQDAPNRFIVHFNTPTAPTGLEPISDNFLQCYYSNGELVIKGLLPSDLGGTITVFDIQGRTLKKATIAQTPETHIPFALGGGVYIAKLQGNRTVTVKFMK
jgi:hypothetical protein